MKKIVCTVIVAMVLASCKNNEAEVAKEKEVAFKVFGDSISADGAISKEDMFAKYKDLKEGDTVEVKFASKIKEVCQKKGCWMQLELPENNSAFVKFKDYGFFVPLNSANSDVILNGKAFISVESVEELRHYAKDAGESQAAIDSIVNPETTYSFMADGVLIKK